MKVKLEPGAYPPERAHNTDAGYDLRAVEGVYIDAGGAAVIDTGVHVVLPPGTAGLLVSKSGLNVAHGITSTGHMIQGGDKITQLVVLPIETPEIVLVDSLPETDRGNKGFGSTGR